MGAPGFRKILEALLYLFMLLCVIAFFTGHGTFIYEGF